MATIESFIQGDTRNLYVRFEDCELYVRKGKRNPGVGSSDPALWAQYLDIANIVRRSRAWNINCDEDVRSTGFLNRMMGHIEAVCMANGMGIYHENVVNQWLPAWHERRGYLLVPGEHIAPCYYLPPEAITVMVNARSAVSL